MPGIPSQSIKHGFKKSSVVEFEKKALIKKINSMNDLPAPSATVGKIVHLLRDQNSTIAALVEQVEKDQSLVAQILKLINSGFYSLRRAVDNVGHAINLLGILQVKQLVYSASVMDIFGKDQEKSWKHSYSCSVLMAQLVKENQIPAAHNLPLSMIMHDLGKVVLRRFSPKKYKMVDMKLESGGILTPYNAEDDVFNINHAEVGGILLRKWDMEENIVKPISQHHIRDYVPEDFVLETALIQFVDYVDNRAREQFCEPPSERILSAAGFEEIDNDYWIDYQRKVIEDIESPRQLDD